jgi:hypothetical protein
MRHMIGRKKCISFISRQRLCRRPVQPANWTLQVNLKFPVGPQNRDEGDPLFRTKKVRSMQGHRTNFLRVPGASGACLGRVEQTQAPKGKKVRDPSSNSGSNWEFQVKFLFQLAVGGVLLFGGSALSYSMETVWISSTVFTKVEAPPIGGAVDLEATAGDNNIVSLLYNRTNLNDATFELLRTTGSIWEKVLVSSSSGALEYKIEANAVHHVRVDSSGTNHVLFSVNVPFSFTSKLDYGNNAAGIWSTETVATDPGLNSSALAVDSHDGIHVAYRTSDALIYAKRVAGSWQKETVLTSNRLMSVLSLGIGNDDRPVVGIVTWSPDFTVRVWKKTSSVWTAFPSYFGPYRNFVLRVDSLNRIHLAIVDPSNSQIRYVRLSSSGTSELDKGIAVAGINIGSRCDMVLDRDDVAHIVVASTLINAATEESTALPLTFLSPAISLRENGDPVFFGLLSSTATSTWTLLAPLNRSSAPIWTSRTPTSLTWTWESLPNPLTGAQLINAGNGINLSDILPTSAAEWTVQGLGPNSGIQVRARALYPGFFADSDSSVLVHTLSNPPTALFLSRPTGNTLNVAWQRNGNPIGTVYRLTLTPPSSVPLIAETTNSSWVFSSLDPSQLFALTVKSVNGDGVETVVSSAVRVSFAENVRETGFALDNGLSVTVRVSGPPSPPEPTIAVVPEESFPATSDDLISLGVGFHLAAVPSLPAGQSGSVSLSWSPGQVNPPAGSSLVLARYDLDRQTWIALPTSRGTHTLTARTVGYGLFQIMAQNQNDAASAAPRVFPNPFRPVQEDLTIRGASPGAEIRIVDVRGQRIRGLTADSLGTASWDGTDTAGNPTGSGVYTVLVGEGTPQRLRVLLKR